MSVPSAIRRSLPRRSIISIARSEKLGLPKDFVLHSFRHSMLARLGEAGVDAFTLCESLDTVASRSPRGTCIQAPSLWSVGSSVSKHSTRQP